MEIKTNVHKEVLDSVAKSLDKFVDMTPTEFRKEMPPRRPTNHKIELVHGVVPPSQVPY